jgi:hypothetical protein
MFSSSSTVEALSVSPCPFCNRGFKPAWAALVVSCEHAYHVWCALTHFSYSIWCQHGELTRSSSSRCTRDGRIELMTLAAAGNYLQARPLRIQSVCWQLYINPSYSHCMQFIQNAILPFVFRNFFCSSFDLCALINPFNSLLDCSCEFQPFGKLVFRVPILRRWVDLCSSDGNELSRPGRYAVSAHHYEFPR